MELKRDTVVEIAPHFRLGYQAAQESYFLLYPKGVIRLNETAVEILKRCDGQRTVAGIIADLEREFSEGGLETDVLEFMEQAHEKGWISRKQVA